MQPLPFGLACIESPLWFLFWLTIFEVGILHNIENLLNQKMEPYHGDYSFGGLGFRV